MELILLFSLWGLVLCFIWNVYSKDSNNKAISCFCVIMCSAMSIGTLIVYNTKNNPTALNVYQGKTTLEITYRDSVPVDSVVVFKPEFKK